MGGGGERDDQQEGKTQTGDPGDGAADIRTIKPIHRKGSVCPLQKESRNENKDWAGKTKQWREKTKRPPGKLGKTRGSARSSKKNDKM